MVARVAVVTRAAVATRVAAAMRVAAGAAAVVVTLRLESGVA